ncbi:MAG: dTDP-4-dehydrorhamnose 3,5-epimerase [Pseudonocardiales bacterium]|nr:MAG: dTDP-4-dehydrorhamnose 3,5-epimerase [Pseudonocardiales bacterium]
MAYRSDRAVIGRRLTVPDSFEFILQSFSDDRGSVTPLFNQERFTELVSHSFRVAQVNHNISRRGTVRGIHFTETPPGQAKYVFCLSGSLLDVVVDVREGSPTFGQWDAVTLTAHRPSAVYLAEGLGHACMALEEDTSMAYLCSTEYNPGIDHAINPVDVGLAISWPTMPIALSDKDAAAPTLAEASEQRILPRYSDCLSHYRKKVSTTAPKEGALSS